MSLLWLIAPSLSLLYILVQLLNRVGHQVGNYCVIAFWAAVEVAAQHSTHGMNYDACLRFEHGFRGVVAVVCVAEEFQIFHPLEPYPAGCKTFHDLISSHLRRHKTDRCVL